MASIIPGYNYDIFISYRQKDNKHDGWVTEFVNNLKGELESTFKEEISVYFDINPHDGLLETHDVDASLKEKLKCLIFIPIISRTYCDPRSFAWEHEFKAFVEMASKDQFGLKVKLPNGNVASRVVPVRIHDLSENDIKLCESVLNSVLRGIEFIYREPGVNRPLTPADDDKINLSKTRYRNQINKLALTINDIVTSIQNPVVSSPEIPSKFRGEDDFRRKYLRAGFFVLLFIASIVFIPKIFKPPLAKSIAVLPFYNMTPGDSTGFLDGLVAGIIDNLNKIKDVNVPSRTSSAHFGSRRDITMPEIGKQLNVNYVVEVSGEKSGGKQIFRIHLYEARKDRHLWGENFDQKINSVSDFENISTTVVNAIARILKISISSEERQHIETPLTKDLDALVYYRRGIYSFWKAGATGQTDEAISFFRKAIANDSEFAQAYTGIANAFIDQYFFYKDRSEQTLNKSRNAIDSAFRIAPGLPEAHMAMGNYYYVQMKYEEALNEFLPVLKSRPDDPEANFWTACVYRRSGNWEKAKPLFIKSVKLQPQRAEFINDLAITYDFLRDYDSSTYYYRNAIALQPDWPYLYYNYVMTVLKQTGDPVKAGSIIQEMLTEERSESDQDIIELKIRLEMIKSEYSTALRDIALFKSDAYVSQEVYKPKYQFYAEVYSLMGKKDLSRAYFDSSRIFLEKKIAIEPEDHRYWSSLGIAFAGEGIYDKALTAGEKAISLVPLEKEAFKGSSALKDMARIYMMTGNHDKAIVLLKKLLSVPGDLSVKLLEIEPVWAPMKNDPEFQKLLKDRE